MYADMNPQFFIKHAGAHTHLDAIKLMKNKIHAAKHMCKEGDKMYLKELACLTEMLHDYFEANGIADYKSLL